jgi:hypothetical protein
MSAVLPRRTTISHMTENDPPGYIRADAVGVRGFAVAAPRNGRSP